MKRTVLILAMLTVCSSFALGQAIPGATRPLDLQVGGTFTFADPDYTPQAAVGGGVYAALDFSTHWGVEADFHDIYIDQHSPAHELTYEGGVRYRGNYDRYNPYLKLMGGRGTFDFAPGFQELVASESYNLLAVGAGVDTELTTHLNLRVEVEYQNWFANGSSGPENINGFQMTGGYLPNGLTPILCQIGFAYHFAGGAAAQ